MPQLIRKQNELDIGDKSYIESPWFLFLLLKKKRKKKKKLITHCSKFLHRSYITHRKPNPMMISTLLLKYKNKQFKFCIIWYYLIIWAKSLQLTSFHTREGKVQKLKKKKRKKHYNPLKIDQPTPLCKHYSCHQDAK